MKITVDMIEKDQIERTFRRSEWAIKFASH